MNFMTRRTDLNKTIKAKWVEGVNECSLGGAPPKQPLCLPSQAHSDNPAQGWGQDGGNRDKGVRAALGKHSWISGAQCRLPIQTGGVREDFLEDRAAEPEPDRQCCS